MIESERYKKRMATAVWRRYYAGDKPVVADADEVKELRDFEAEVMGIPRDLLKGPVRIYGVPVVDADGKPWEW
jgi:hypothetical protein